MNLVWMELSPGNFGIIIGKSDTIKMKTNQWTLDIRYSRAFKWTFPICREMKHQTVNKTMYVLRARNIPFHTEKKWTITHYGMLWWIILSYSLWNDFSLNDERSSSQRRKKTTTMTTKKKSRRFMSYEIWNMSK